jgi:hypothetical protein
MTTNPTPEPSVNRRCCAQCDNGGAGSLAAGPSVSGQPTPDREFDLDEAVREVYTNAPAGYGKNRAEERRARGWM